jgi:uncharacterized membrane protein YtjA (UPF0391 family)
MPRQECLANLPPGTGLGKAIVTRATGVFAREAKAFSRTPPAVGTSCSAKGYIGGFNAGGGRQAGGFAVTLLKWALIFLVISIIAGILGFTGISAASADIARFLFYVFVVIFLVLLILGLTIFRV